MNVDDELRRMFDDLGDRLDVPVRFDATEVILAGARRVRRRRIAAATVSGVLAVVLLAGAGILLTRPGPESAPPAVTWNGPPPSTAWSASASVVAPPRVPSTTNEPPAGSATGGVRGPAVDGGPAGEEEPPRPRPERPPVTGVQIGPDGFGSVRLGMGYDELVATEAIRGSEPPPTSGCVSYEFTDQAGSGQVQVTSVGGVQAIQPAARTRTAEGVSSEWTLARVSALYPEVTPEVVAAQNPVPVEVRGNPGVVYMIAFTDDVVTGISLRYADQFCA